MTFEWQREFLADEKRAREEATNAAADQTSTSSSSSSISISSDVEEKDGSEENEKEKAPRPMTRADFIAGDLCFLSFSPRELLPLYCTTTLERAARRDIPHYSVAQDNTIKSHADTDR